MQNKVGINTVLRLLGHGGTAATEHSRFPDFPRALSPFSAKPDYSTKIPQTPALLQSMQKMEFAHTVVKGSRAMGKIMSRIIFSSLESLLGSSISDSQQLADTCANLHCFLFEYGRISLHF